MSEKKVFKLTKTPKTGNPTVDKENEPSNSMPVNNDSHETTIQVQNNSTQPNADETNADTHSGKEAFNIVQTVPANTNVTDKALNSSTTNPMGDYYNSERYKRAHSIKPRYSLRPGGVAGANLSKFNSIQGSDVHNGDMGEMDTALASANHQIFELRSEKTNLEYRVQFLEGEVSRHQHQIGACKAQYKALQSEVYELQTAKILYGERNEDMIAEKEELQQEMTEAIMAEREKVQSAQLQIMDLNIQLDKSSMELADKERLLSQVMNENNKLKRYRQEMRETDSGQKDVQVKLFQCEKQKAILERENEKLTEIVTERDDELKRLKAENAELTESLRKCQAEVGTVGAFMTALAQKKKAGEKTQKGVRFSDRVGIVDLGSTLTDAMRESLERSANDDSVNEVGMELSENLHLRVVHVDNVEEALSIERDGLRALVVEGMILFEEVYNSYRVMQNIGYEDAKTAAKMMIDDHNRSNNIITDGGYNTDNDHHRSRSPTHRSRTDQQYNGVISQQFMTSCGGTKGCYFSSWYCQKGPELLIAWLKCLNLYSPSLVNMLLNAGFWDVHSLVHMTEADMQGLHIITGVRRKLLSGIDELREKTKIVTEETLSMLRDTFCMSEERYIMERERRAEEGALRINNTVIKKNVLDRTKKEMMDVARELPYDDDMPQGMDNGYDSKLLTANSTKSKKGEYISVSPLVKKAAPIVLAELLKDMHAWFSDVRATIDGNEAAVKRALEMNSTR